MKRCPTCGSDYGREKTLRLGIVTVGVIAVLWITASHFDVTELKALAAIVAVLAGDKYDLHRKLLGLVFKNGNAGDGDDPPLDDQGDSTKSNSAAAGE